MQESNRKELDSLKRKIESQTKERLAKQQAELAAAFDTKVKTTVDAETSVLEK